MTKEEVCYTHMSTSYIRQLKEHGDCVIIFALKDKVTHLIRVLKLFQDNQISLKHIESSSSKQLADVYEFLVTFDGQRDANNLLAQLEGESAHLDVKMREEKPGKNKNTTPWFPRRIRDLDMFANNILTCGSELNADHPGFNDQEYRARRSHFADIAQNYRYGQPIPRVKYTHREIETWRTVYDKVVHLHRRYACKEYNHFFLLMEENCGFSRDNIPQLDDVSRFLKDSTGFTLRPVAGLLSSRDFLAGLAHRVFHSTQYIRHHDSPEYTPEPDICHELLGHAPLLADPDFARFSQELGLASLGAPDEYIEKLATCYWFTIEFGLCRQQGQVKVYGASLLSSFGELEYSMSDEPKILPFEPHITGSQKYSITEYQPVYFLAESFADAQEKLHDFAAGIPRPTVIRYNPYTQSVVSPSGDSKM